MSKRNTSRRAVVRRKPEATYVAYPAGDQIIKQSCLLDLELDRLVDQMGSDETPDNRTCYNN